MAPSSALARTSAKVHHVAVKTASHGKSSKGRHAHVAPRPTASFVARDAFYSGDFQKAYELAPAAGERWIAGLASYRMHSYVEAFQHFQAVAQDENQDAWTRSGAAYWAARSAADAGLTTLETPLLRQAASYPWTFYGMIAERQLGLEPVATFSHIVTSPDIKLAEANDAIVKLVRVSETGEAQDPASPDYEMAPIPDAGASAYPVPALAPAGGFTVDPALVYALIRQESRFNPDARSRVGAMGLMQLMPDTAARTAGDDRYRYERSLLRDPAVNMKIGQDYLNVLVGEQVGDDLLMVIAAYNGGPGAVAKARQRGGDDPLMQIETLPARETREYVERVMAGYWLYRRQFGENTPSLEALAAGNRVSIAFDSSNPASRIQQASHVAITNAGSQPVSGGDAAVTTLAAF